MKNKIKLSVLILAATLFEGSMAGAGPSTSGGGFAVVCRQSVGKIQHAELLDLYEARILHKFELMKSTGHLEEDYLRVAKNSYRLQGYILPISKEEVLDSISRFNKITVPFGLNERLPNLHDTGETAAPPDGCDIEPVAVFYDEQYKVEVDQEILNAFDSLNQVALINHETNYHFLRGLGVNPDRNSKEARIVTAAAFALNLTPVLSGLNHSDTESLFCGHSTGAGDCESPTVFYKIKNFDIKGNESHIIQFTHIAGRFLLDKTTVKIPLAVQEGMEFPIESKQLKGWKVRIIRDLDRAKWAVKMVIMRGSSNLVEIPL